MSKRTPFLLRWLGVNPTNRTSHRTLVITYSLLGFISTTIFGFVHIFFENNLFIGMLEITGGGVFLINILGLKVTRNGVIARSVFLVTVLVLLMLTHVSGDTQGTGIFWLLLYAVAAFVLAGKRQGVWWVIGLIVTTMTVLALRRFGIIVTPYAYVEFRQLMVILPVMVVAITIYQNAQAKSKLLSNKSKEALLEQKIRAETVLENISEGVVVVDADGSVLRMNLAAQGMLGWTEEDAIGKQFTEVVPAVDETGSEINAKDRPLQKMLRSTTMPIELTMHYRRKDGSVFLASIFGRSIVVNNKVLGAIGTFRDITKEQELEDIKGEFVSLASHQLRTPISSVRWVAEMLLSGDAGKLSSEQRDYIEQIYASNQRSVSIVDSLLLASSMELGKISVRPEEIDLSVLTGTVVKGIRVAAAKKGQEISEHYEKALSKIAVDPDLMRIILETILINAVKYTQDGGKISVSITKNDKKLNSKSHGTVSIAITDNGYGIPKDQQRKVFAKLFRATNIKGKDTDGTGLGLHVVKMILKQVGGRIHFESVENRGSTFIVLLPIEGMIAHG